MANRDAQFPTGAMNPAGEDYACEQDGLLAGDGDAATRWFGWGGANVSQTPMSPGIDPEGTTPHLVRAAYRKQFSKSLSWKVMSPTSLETFALQKLPLTLAMPLTGDRRRALLAGLPPLVLTDVPCMTGRSDVCGGAAVVRAQGSIRGSVFNLCSATLGAGALSLPFAVKGMGVALGLLLTVLCGFTTVFSIHLLILARTATGLSSYEEISAHLFGSTAAGFVEFGIVSFCFGTGVSALPSSSAPCSSSIACALQQQTLAPHPCTASCIPSLQPSAEASGGQVAYCKTLMDFLEPLLEQMEVPQPSAAICSSSS